MKVKLLCALDASDKLLVADARNLLFNLLFAKHHHGHLLLRLSDLKEVPEDLQVDPVATLSWLGLEWEGDPEASRVEPQPYRVSRRVELYSEYAGQLIEKGLAYRCFCTRETLRDMFIQQKIRGQTPHYDGRCLRLSPAELEAALEAKTPYQVRLKAPEVVADVHDIVRGKLVFDPQEAADLVFVQYDGIPSLALANVVDHHVLGITHVMRGDRLKALTVREAFLSQAFEFKMPDYIHIPLLLGEDRSLLSERHGDVYIEDFRDRGYLPEALLSYLAHQGINPGPEDHLRSLGALTKTFKVEEIFQDPTVWNVETLQLFNRLALDKYKDEALAPMLEPYVKAAGYDLFERGEEWARDVVGAIRTGLNTLSDVKDYIDVFFATHIQPTKKVQTLLKDADARRVVEALEEALQDVEEVTPENYRELLDAARSQLSSRGKALVLVRATLTGRDLGPEFSKLLHLLGKKQMLARLDSARRYIPRGTKRD